MGLKPANERIAVIAVHGVADQRQGDTARALADLLIGAAPSTEYLQHGSEDIALHVAVLPPLTPAAGAAAAQEQASPASGAFAQSHASDFHRHGGLHRAQAHDGPADPGVAMSDFLLMKASHNGMPTESYATTRLDLQRVLHGADGSVERTQDVHVYEMYWADLSRLSGSLPRILTETFTMVFRLSQLARDTVRGAAEQFKTGAGPSAHWQWLSRLQTLLDWGFSKGLALLTLQLLMIALVIVPLGLAAQGTDFLPAAHQVVMVALPLALLPAYLYKFRTTFLSMTAAVAVLGGVGLLVWQAPAAWVVGLVWLTLLSAAYELVMRVCEKRFPFTRPVGWGQWAVVLAGMLLSAALASHAPPAGLGQFGGLHLWVFAALRSLELVLLATIAWWFLAGLTLSAWLVLGQALSWRSGFEGRASIATGRLGLIAPMGMFVILTMAAWALLSTLLDMSVAGMQYLPLIFGTGEVMPAQRFLEQRYVNSTETFSVVALLMLGLLAYLLLIFLPSILAETRMAHENPRRLGRWLTGGYRHLDLVVSVIVTFAVLAALLAGSLLVAGRLDPGLLPAINEQAPWIPALSQQILRPLILSAASAMVTLSLLGGVVSRYLPGLRAPLDIALDVDNHFREFPRQGIPRARIFARYFALLRHLSRQGYDRIVIVSHSQGTVISAELLRYLKFRAERTPGDPLAEVWHNLSGTLQLLTAGSPLRQLYAARFPTLYRWVLQEQYGRMGPSAAGLGVQRWINAYTTGDYVGRWLWSRPAREPGDMSDALVDQVVAQDDVYLPPPALPPQDPVPPGWREWDVCLGSGAHTHYFDPDQLEIARLVDRLIAG